MAETTAYLLAPSVGFLSNAIVASQHVCSSLPINISQMLYLLCLSRLGMSSRQQLRLKCLKLYPAMYERYSVNISVAIWVYIVSPPLHYSSSAMCTLSQKVRDS